MPIDPPPKAGLSGAGNHVVEFSALNARRTTEFTVTPDGRRRSEICGQFGLLALRKLSFHAALRSDGRSDWRLDGTLGATVEQPCVVTLEPVTTRLDVAFTRRFIADDEGAQAPSEVEFDGDEQREPLTPTIDLEDILLEVLALNLPLYPRVDDALLGQAQFAAPGVSPLRDEDAKPFAPLAALRDKMNK